MEYIGESQPEHASIEFRHVSISFDDPDRLATYINHVEPGVIVAHGPLTDSLRHNYLRTTLGDDQETTSIGAMVECAIDGASLFDDNWQDDLFDELEGYYSTLSDSYVSTLPHEPDALYIHHLLQKHALRIKAACEPDSCSVYISLVNNKFIEHARGNTIRAEESNLDSPDYTLLYNVAQAWAKVQNTLMSRYLTPDENTAYTAIHIQPPENWTPPPSDETIMQPSNSVTPPSLDEPKHEVTNHIHRLTEAFDVLGGHLAAKERLTEIGAAYADPDSAALFHINAPSFLLQGEPGTGKTTLVKAFAEATQADLVTLSASDIQSKFIGETGKLIDQHFQAAIDADVRTILFFDEIDTLIHVDNHPYFHKPTKRLGELIEYIGEAYPHVLVAGCMNTDPADVIESIIRPGRLEVITLTPPSTYQELADTWFSVLYAVQPPFQYASTDPDNQSTPASYDETINIPQLAQQSYGLTGADMAHILATIRQKKFRDYQLTGRMVAISQTDIKTQLDVFRSQYDD